MNPSLSEKDPHIKVWPSPLLPVAPLLLALAILGGSLFSDRLDTDRVVPAVFLIFLSLMFIFRYRGGALVFFHDRMRRGKKSVRFCDIDRVDRERGGFGAGRYIYYNFYNASGEKIFVVNPTAYGVSANKLNRLLQSKCAHLKDIDKILTFRAGHTIAIWAMLIAFFIFIALHIAHSNPAGI